MMRLRKIWAEGSFSVLKREHCLSKIRKRGIPAVTEECLLSAMALNLKRMVRAILLTSHTLKIRAKNILFQLGFLFCQQAPYCTLSKQSEHRRKRSPNASCSCISFCPTVHLRYGADGHRRASALSCRRRRFRLLWFAAGSHG